MLRAPGVHADHRVKAVSDVKQRTCIECGENFQRAGNTARCIACSSTGVCVVCGERTRRIGTKGKVPQICSDPCRVARAKAYYEAIKKNPAQYHELKKRSREANRLEVRCLECAVVIPFVVGARRHLRCDACRPLHERVRTQEKDRRRQWRRSGIDMTPERFAQLVQDQGGCCAICHQAVAHWHVDHCHETGQTRGLLCMRCNMALGSFDDDPDRLRTAAAYLEMHRFSVHTRNDPNQRSSA